MNTMVMHGHDDPNRIGHHANPLDHGAHGPAGKRILVGYGFWVFLLSDIIMFSAIFAAYAVLSHSTAGGPSGKDIFNLNVVALETGCLLLSSFACGMGSIAVHKHNQFWTQVWLLITGLTGLAFLLIEIHEFIDLINKGFGPDRSAFLSAFFTLVGCHGTHITIGLLWLGTMMAQIYAKGFRQEIQRRFLCFSLFWHALDIIWVAIFSLVYLMGVTV